VFEQYKKAVAGKSNFEARQIAREAIGQDVNWNWDREYRCQCLEVFTHVLQFPAHPKASIELLVAFRQLLIVPSCMHHTQTFCGWKPVSQT